MVDSISYYNQVIMEFTRISCVFRGSIRSIRVCISYLWIIGVPLTIAEFLHLLYNIRRLPCYEAISRLPASNPDSGKPNPDLDAYAKSKRMLMLV